MFLRIVDVYYLHLQSFSIETQAFGIKIDIYLEATIVRKKIIYMNHFYPLWIEHWGNPWPLITPKENKTNGVIARAKVN